MLIDRINETELAILNSLDSGPRTISQLAKGLDLSVVWISECVAHLNGMRILEKRRAGSVTRVTIAENETGESLRLMIAESPYLNLSKVLTGPGLALLPLLISPGTTQVQTQRKTGLSRPTIGARFGLWRGMGLILLERAPHRYVLNPSRSLLVRFVEAYTRERNQRFLRGKEPSGVIVWQRRDEFLFSMDAATKETDFMSAGATRLVELGYNIVHSREYFMYSADIRAVPEEEALIQTLEADPENPRPMRFIRDAVQGHKADVSSIREYAIKYGLKTRLIKEGLFDGEQENVQTA